MLDKTADLLPELTGGAGLTLAASRPAAFEALAASYEALLGPASSPHLSAKEKRLVATAVAHWHAEPLAAAFYTAEAEAAGAGIEEISAAREGRAEDPRLQALLAHAHMLTFAPIEGSPEKLATLRAAGVSEDGLIALSQLTAFLSHQLRAAFTLRLLGA
ncbi:carboxymuconolactone decarboxylase family protein [Pseudooceanicola sp. CBS1P-1]|uniref:Uncharacterized protein n=1 Tax=Pseudooceanicola albus TaxID=2692189 RepID=A0A6L7G7R0_9RHOB|nr:MULTISPECIES: carboxymuconolactone decarboxylase family protein [Pseudooceanicola]MBT9385418.1 carboxymuconolactone decarboxylase family protein [Pseudooceanicola endophyticus]MXN18723.1 hypothetical protein [Pseudooceanicola albus]